MADAKKILGGLGKVKEKLLAEPPPVYSAKILESTTAKFADKIADANPKLTDAEVQKKALAQATKKLDWERVQKPALEKRYGPLAKASFAESNPNKMQNTAEAVAERKRKANEFLDQPTEPWTPPRPELQAFDRSSIKDALEGFPDVQQSRFPRDQPARASTSHVEELYQDPENRALIEKQIKRGLPLGGESFYASLYPVKQAVLEAGMPAEKFDKWIHSLAPASARNSIMNEMAVGQFLRNMNARGIPLSEENVAKEMALYKEKFGIGLPLMPIHRQGVANVLEGGVNLREHNLANIPTNYKIPTYGTQKAGDFAESTVLDVHEAGGHTQGSRFHPYFNEQGGFGNTEYGKGEEGLLSIAKDLGIPGGMAQAGRWFGGGELTGLKSPRGDALDLLEKQVAFTLQQKGIQPNPANVRKELLKQIETGEGDLLPWYRKEGMPDVRETGLQRAEGGVVDIDAADARLTAAIEKRMAKGGAVDIEAADARLEAAINARMGMKDGGGAFKRLDFTEEDSPVQVGLHANKQGDMSNSGVIANLDMKGAGRLGVGTNISSRGNEMNPATMLNYSNNVGDLGLNANVMKPSNARDDMLMTNVMASYPIGEGRVSAGMHGSRRDGTHQVNAHSLGYNAPVGGGNLNLNVTKPKQGSAMVGAQYQRPFAEGGQAEFKKLEFMVDGGKVVKGASNLMKKLFADSKVLPQAEREANLQKFLAPSAEKRRMYHGSKEPNITEFKTRKDLTNEDNMTGHYADERDAVFLSPDPEFSKDFSVWGYTDEGKAPTTYPVYAQVERPFDFDNPEHLQKVKATYLDMFHNPESEFYDPHITSSERSMDLHRFNQKVDDLPKDENNWGRIENQQFQDVLKDLGFDSFYTRERGTKNLGIYDPNRIKSAIGNRGTYDLGESDITKADGGKIVGGLGKIAKKLMADNTLPAVEREANKAKFLNKSKVVDYNGKPIKMYHHTTNFIGDEFNPKLAQEKDRGYHGQGMYFGADDYLNRSAFGRHSEGNIYGSEGFIEGSQVMPVYLSIKNPKYVDITDETLHGMPSEELKKQGYDGVIVTRDDSFVNAMGRDVPRKKIYNAVAFEPEQIKSVTGNRGTYDINEPDLNKSDGGKIVKGLSKVAKKLLEEPRIQTIEAPSIIIPSKLSNVKEMARKREGEYGARRVERASDEIPNLEKMYQEEALRSAFTGDNARALMTMNPADFENYAAPLKPSKHKPAYASLEDRIKSGELYKDDLPTDEYVNYLRSISGGFDAIPFLEINKGEQGLPLTPFISGHEGRHRNRALAGSGESTNLIQLLPRAELREPFPRRSQEEYIEALKKELAMTNNMVLPEKFDMPSLEELKQTAPEIYEWAKKNVKNNSVFDKKIQRSEIELPDIYAEGGAAFKTLQFKDAQHFDGGGIAFPEMTPMTEGSRREPLLTEKDWENIKRNAPEVYEWAKQNVKDEASQLKSARGVKDFALRTGAQYLGGIPDLVNLGLMGVDALADTNLSSEKPWFGSEQYIDAMRKVGMVGENEFPIAETVAGVLMPAGLIKKGIKKISGAKPAKQEPKKRQGGLSAMAR